MKATVLLVLLLLGGSIAAQESKPTWPPDTWTVAAEVQASFVAGGDLDDASGDFDTSIVEPMVRVRGPAWEGALLAFFAGYEYRHYEFDGAQPFFPTLEDPWEDVHSVNFGVHVLQGLSRNWGVFVGAQGRASASANASLGDGLSGLFLAGAGYDFENGFRIGVGVAGLLAFEDEFRIFPALQFDWRIDDHWRAKLEGLRFDLTYSPDEEWTFGVGARADGARFRLPDTPVRDESIVEDRRIATFLSAAWNVDDSIKLAAEVGVDVYRSIRIEDKFGDNGRSYESGVAPFFGLGLTFTF